jgi:hypothetical protein
VDYKKDQVWTKVSNHYADRYFFWIKDCIIVDVIYCNGGYNLNVRNNLEQPVEKISRSLKCWFYCPPFTEFISEEDMEINLIFFKSLLKAKEMGWGIERFEILKEEVL